MYRVVVTDKTAASRQSLATYLSCLVRDPAVLATHTIPPIEVLSLAPEELAFHTPPHIIVVGPEICSKDPPQLSTIRGRSQSAVVLACVSETEHRLALFEQLARLGAHDALSPTISAQAFAQKVLFHTRSAQRDKGGQLVVVDSGKGGIGATSFVAALGDCVASHGKRVVLVDLDTTSSDLTRFLGARPFNNENLSLLLNGDHPITKDAVQQCLSDAGDSDRGLFSMPPPLSMASANVVEHDMIRRFLSVLEVLDAEYDTVIIDCASAPSALIDTLFQVADRLVITLARDPAASAGTIQRVRRARSLISATATLHLVVTSTAVGGLRLADLRSEMLAATDAPESSWTPTAIPYVSALSRWPGSGSTLYSLNARSDLSRRVDVIAGALGLIPAVEEPTLSTSLASQLGAVTSTALSGLLRALRRRGAQSAPVELASPPIRSNPPQPSLPDIPTMIGPPVIRANPR